MATEEEALTAVSGVVSRKGPFPEPAADTKIVLSDSVAAALPLPLGPATSATDEAASGCVSVSLVREEAGSLGGVAGLGAEGVSDV